MLADEGTAVDGNYLVTGEGALELADGEIVEVGLVIDGDEDGGVHDEEIGISGGETLTILIVAGTRHGERHEAVGVAFGSAEGTKLLLHGRESGMMLIGRIGALHVGNGIGRTKAGEGVNVGIGIVASEITMMEPEDALYAKTLAEKGLHLRLIDRGDSIALMAAVGIEKTLGSGEESAAAIALDSTPFEFEVKTIHVSAGDDALLVETGIDGIVEVGTELPSPSVETEIEELRTGAGEEGDETVVARPGVVGRTREVADALQHLGGQTLLQQCTDGIRLGGDDEKGLTKSYLIGHAEIGFGHLGEHIGPVGGGMRPCELYEALRRPFGGKGAARTTLFLLSGEGVEGCLKFDFASLFITWQGIELGHCFEVIRLRVMC